MAHELEIIDGKASAAFVVTGEGQRKVPWHHLGTFVTEAMTAEQALTLANLDWDVSLMDLTTVTYAPVPGRKAVVRTNPATGQDEVLGIVGSKWRPVQNRQAFSFCDHVVQAVGDAHYETAGMMRPVLGNGALGAQTFVTLQRPDLFLDPQGRNDQISRYLFCANGFDASRAFTLKITNVRVVCKNTNDMALAGSGAAWKVNHTRSVEGRMEEAQKALGLISRHDEAMVAACERLIQTEITNGQFAKLVKAVFPEPSEDAGKLTVSRYEESIDTLHALYVGANNATITGTAWGAYNAVTEFLDWERPNRAKGEAARATQVLLSPHVAAKKLLAFDRAMALAKV